VRADQPIEDLAQSQRQLVAILFEHRLHLFKQRERFCTRAPISDKSAGPSAHTCARERMRLGRRLETKRAERGRGSLSPTPAISGNASEMDGTPVVKGQTPDSVNELQTARAKLRGGAFAE
jgi:hypothetical protein